MAATSDAQHIRIIAGAGTGKTRTLTYRLAYMMERGNMLPSQIVSITFTNKVANEMKEKVLSILKKDDFSITRMPCISTFHGFCYRFLRKELATHYNGYRNPFTIADEADQAAIFKKVAEKLKMVGTSKEFKDLKMMVGSYKSKGVEYKDLPVDASSRYYNRDLSDVYKIYQETLAIENKVDFDDLLIFTRDIMENDKPCREKYGSYYKAFMIDEFQDTNDIQYEIVKLFMAPSTELCVVGDPDQTIYTWRGANNKLIKTTLQNDFKDLQTVTLDLNYRSTQEILDKANLLIKNNKNRIDKTLSAFNKKTGDNVDFFYSYTNEDEARELALRIKSLHVNKKVPYSDIAVIYRSNFLSRVIEKFFPIAGVPYRLYGGQRFYERVEIKAALAYLRLLVNTGDNESFELVLQSPSIKVGDKTLEAIYAEADKAQLPIFEYIVNSLDGLPIRQLQKDSLHKIVKAYNNCISALNKAATPEEMSQAIDHYFSEAGFLEYVAELDRLDKEKLGEDKDQTRSDNIKELYSAFESYIKQALSDVSGEEEPTLTDFLINIALESDQDTITSADAVSVMTGHVSKGLEFSYVFVTGLVDGIFPTGHAIDDNASGNKEAIEEERRLFYVAMTRAKNYLCISSFGGTRYGSEYNIPSPFLKEIGFKTSSENQNFSVFSNRNSSASYTSKGVNRIFSAIDRSAAKGGYQINDEERYTDSNASGAYTPQKLSGLTRAGYASRSSTDVKYNIGDKIAHSSYGVGVVSKVIDNKIVVDFNDVNIGQKTLMIGFKAFKKI